jgi:hypothetical protein
MKDTWAYKQNTIPAVVTLLGVKSPYAAIVPPVETVGAFATGNSTWSAPDASFYGHRNA